MFVFSLFTLSYRCLTGFSLRVIWYRLRSSYTSLFRDLYFKFPWLVYLWFFYLSEIFVRHFYVFRFRFLQSRDGSDFIRSFTYTLFPPFTNLWSLFVFFRLLLVPSVGLQETIAGGWVEGDLVASQKKTNTTTGWKFVDTLFIDIKVFRTLLPLFSLQDPEFHTLSGSMILVWVPK